MEYKLIALNDHEALEDMVNNLLADGWSLSGNLVVTRQLLRDGDFDECFYQAMTRALA
mgnify:CR=1 FL=1